MNFKYKNLKKLVLVIIVICDVLLFTVDAQQVGSNVNSAPGSVPTNVQAGPVVNSAQAYNNQQTIPSSNVPVVNSADPSQVPSTNTEYYAGTSANIPQGYSNAVNYNPSILTNPYNSQMNSNYQTNPSTYNNYQTNPTYPGQTNLTYPGQTNPTYPGQIQYPSNYQNPTLAQGYEQSPNYNSYNGQQNQPYNNNYYNNNPSANYNPNYVPNRQTGPFAPPAYSNQNNYANTNPTASNGYNPSTNYSPTQMNPSQNYMNGQPIGNNQWQASNAQNYAVNGQNTNQQGTNYGYNPVVNQPNIQMDPSQNYANGQYTANNQWQGSNSQNYVANSQPGVNYVNKAGVNQPNNYANGANSQYTGNQYSANYNTNPQNTAYNTNSAFPSNNGYVSSGMNTNGNQVQNKNTYCLNQIDDNMCSQYAQQGMCAQYGPQCDAACLRC